MPLWYNTPCCSQLHDWPVLLDTDSDLTLWIKQIIFHLDSSSTVKCVTMQYNVYSFKLVELESQFSTDF